MIVLGLTGSIGMGKSTAAAMLRRLGLPVFDADRTVHGLLAPEGGAVEAVLAIFPDVGNAAGGIDRQRLGGRVFGDTDALRRLERVIHPLVARAERQFLATARRQGQSLAILDVPLLLEGGGARRCDYVLVVSAPAFLQRQRVMRRPSMTDSRLKAILDKQMPDRDKRRQADFVVATGLGHALTLRRLQGIVRILKDRASSCPGNARRKRLRRN